MALSLFITAPERFFGNPTSSFEVKVKKCLGWSRRDWVAAGMQNTLFSTLISSLKYWNDQLEEAMGPLNVILTLYNVHRETFIDLDDVVDAILEIGPHIKVSGYSNLENRRYVSIELENENMKNEVLQKLKYVGEANVVFLNWVSQNTTLNLNIQWLPKHMPLSKIEDFLKPYVDVVEIERLDTVSRRGKVLPSGDLNVKATLRKGILLSELPYIFYIGKLRGMLSVPGRQPICLTCRRIGHLSYSCETPYCKACRRQQPRVHKCGEAARSYAAIVRRNEEELQPPTFGQAWGDRIEEEDALASPSIGGANVRKDLGVQKHSFIADNRSKGTESVFSDAKEVTDDSFNEDFPQLPSVAEGMGSGEGEFPSSELGLQQQLIKFEDDDLQPGQGEPEDEGDQSSEMDFQTVSNKRKSFVPEGSGSESGDGSREPLPQARKLNTYGRETKVLVPTKNLFDVLVMDEESKTQDNNIF